MNVDRSGFLGISLCSGVGMLDEGIKLAFPGARTACFVEWEAYAYAEFRISEIMPSLGLCGVWGAPSWKIDDHSEYCSA